VEETAASEIQIDPVHFGFDKSNMTDHSKGKIDKLIETLNSNAAYHVKVFGFADSQGPEDYNLKLSQKRVDSVIKYLTSNGILEIRINEKKAFGEAKPVAPNNTLEGRKLNRRVEFEIVKK
jgi:outer membrane protein OmpA-like peptidoglycan-associated protein